MKVSFSVCPKCGSKSEGLYQNYVTSAIRDLNNGLKSKYKIDNIIKRMILPNIPVDSKYIDFLDKAYFYGCDKCGYVFKLKEVFDDGKAGKCWKDFDVESFICHKCGTEISKTPINKSWSDNNKYICYKCGE